MKQQVQGSDQEHINEQIKLAAQLHTEDIRRLDTANERRAATQAAEEMGIPAAYMDRAAADLARQQEARTRQRKHRSAGVIAATLAVVATGGFWHVTHQPLPHPQPLSYNFAASSQGMWRLGQPDGSPPDGKASLSFPQEQGHSVALLKVDHFYPFNGQYNAVDLMTNQIPRSLTGFQTVSFRVRGTGLGQIRLFLQNGEERWCSPFLTASGKWHTLRVPLKQFLHQSVPEHYNPKDAPYVAPRTIGMISFKLGADANPQNAHGEVAIDDLRFE